VINCVSSQNGYLNQPPKDNKDKNILATVFKTTVENVDALLRPWPSSAFINSNINELFFKVLVMVFPLLCAILGLQTLLTFFGPHNNYEGYTGNQP